jgi:chloride channel protein, CIC family
MASDPPADPQALLRSPAYVRLVVLAAVIGVPITALAYGFLKLVAVLQDAVFTDIPNGLGLDPVPDWWLLPVLALGGVVVAAAIEFLPGTGGHSPADGFKAAGPLPPAELPGVVLASLGTLVSGVVLGPEAPLIIIGSGLGVIAIRLAARDAPDQAVAVVAAAGSFAAISTLLGSPLVGAFLLLEASAIGGPMLGIVLMPGLLAAGVGSLVFLGLDSLTGYGTFSLAVPGLPTFDDLTVAMFGYALVFGAVAPFVGRAIVVVARRVRSHVEPRMLLLMPVLGLAIAVLAVLFSQVTDEDTSMVLFSGQDQLGPLLQQAPGWSVGTLLLLFACKSVAYALSLSSFRGGPVFPALFIGATAGVAASRLPGLPLVPAIAMGIGAMSCVMLSLPLTSVLLVSLLLGADGIQVMPVVIVAVAVAYIGAARLAPAPAEGAAVRPPSRARNT